MPYLVVTLADGRKIDAKIVMIDSVTEQTMTITPTGYPSRPPLTTDIQNIVSINVGGTTFEAGPPIDWDRGGDTKPPLDQP